MKDALNQFPYTFTIDYSNGLKVIVYDNLDSENSFLSRVYIKKTKNPFNPTKFIKIEHKKGPLIAPIPNVNCKLAPAATNCSLGIKSFV